MIPYKDYEQEYCPYCEEWLPYWDTVHTDKDLDYPRGTFLCTYHYEDMFPHDNCIECNRKKAVHEMIPMGYWDNEELFICTPCTESYPNRLVTKQGESK